MPKSKKPNSSDGDQKTTWRKPVKLPTIAVVEPMRSLYAANSGAPQPDSPVENSVAEIQFQASAVEIPEQTVNKSQDLADLTFTEKTFSSVPRSTNRNLKPELPSSDDLPDNEDTPEKFSETDFLGLFRTEKMDFYSLAEILRGSSMALYCVLYSESLVKGETRCQIRQSELMMRAGINNPATLYKQERWLTALRLINKSVRLGNHNGASYEVRPLQNLPLPNFILDQFDGYLAKLVK